MNTITKEKYEISLQIAIITLSSRIATSPFS